MRTVVGALLEALVRFFELRAALVVGADESTLALLSSSWTDRNCSDGSVAQCPRP